MSAIANATLTQRLAEALPKNSRFRIHHLSTPPTPCSALYSAPPGAKQEKTFCERHFFSVSIDSDSDQLQIFALEVLIYTTGNLTTLFVSKADSTGYLHLLDLAKGTPSPLKSISTILLAYLVEERQRLDRRLVLSLFARSQDQYLFPGSIENSGKHVLDDRGLVRWWCQVLDPVIRLFPCNENYTSGGISRSASGNETKSGMRMKAETSGKGYLRVPGCDSFETRNFFSDRLTHADLDTYWKVGDPLRELGRSPHWPERCLIPRFPDDPKARYVDELDDELPEPAARTLESPSKGKHPGQWKSVKSLEQFWEMMAFRQECSSGRLVGFIWGVFAPTGKTFHDETNSLESSLASLRQRRTSAILPTSESSQAPDPNHAGSISPNQSRVIRMPPQPSSSSCSSSSSSVLKTNEKRAPRTAKKLPEKTNYYYWPSSSRGEVVLREKDYQRVNKLMLNLDYANKNIATKSTKRWTNDVSVMAGKSWGQIIVGKREPEVASHITIVSDPTMLNAGLVRKKKRGNEDAVGQVAPLGGASDQNGVNVLSVGLIRKKPKIASSSCSGQAPD